MQTPPVPLETSLFAHEIESALVAAAFQMPERIALIMRELDPLVHFSSPALRHILAASALVYRELGSTDFADLVICLREFDQLEACGGIPGVTQILEACPYGFSSTDAAQTIIAHYIGMLKAYALARVNATPVYRFNRGNLWLKVNKSPKYANSPTLVGSGKVAGRRYRAQAYRTQDSYSISLIPE